MRYSIFASSALVAMASAHSTIYQAYVDGVAQGQGNSAAGYIRSPPNNNPVKDITSADMTCNVNNVATTKTIEVAAGAEMILEWHHNSMDSSDDIIDGSHKGPVMAYIAPTASNGAGDVWVKLSESGYDGTTWAVTTLIANKGKQTLTIPSTLAPGDYLVRGEIIALHEADAAYNANSARGAQFYMECVQVKVTGSGATTLPAGVAIPGAYTYTDPGVVFNLYGSFTSYTIPGPAVWDGKTGGTSSPVASSAVVSATKAASSAVVATSAAVVSTKKAVADVTSSSAPVATSAPAVVSSSVPVATSVAAPVSSKATKDSCKSKTSAAAGVPTTLRTVVASSSAPAATSGTSTGAGVALYGQCGGTGFTGATTCASGTCTVQNPYYSQCI